MGVGAAAGETPGLPGEVVGETHRGLERAQAHPLGNQHYRGPVSLWVVVGVTEIWQSGDSAIAPSQPLPHIQHHSTETSVTPPRPGEHLRLHPFK